MAAPLDPAQVSGRSPRLPLSDPQRRGPAARTCGRTVTFDPSPYLLPAVSRSARMGSPRLRVRNPGVRDLRGCGRDLFPGGVGAAGPTQRTLYQEVMLETCGLLASLDTTGGKLALPGRVMCTTVLEQGRGLRAALETDS
ncbi:uncharacterized protein [Manis javanica]|uniref:uncharacterized protein isoform X6 n=1 Tax=Manis javanica TaxID=9974 RepID=UPI003C6D2F45